MRTTARIVCTYLKTLQSVQVFNFTDQVSSDMKPSAANIKHIFISLTNNSTIISYEVIFTINCCG